MTNVMGFPYLDMANSAFSSAQAKSFLHYSISKIQETAMH